MQTRKRCLSFLLCLCLLITCMGHATIQALAATVSTGTVHVDDSLRVRQGPGTNYTQIGNLYNGDVVTILEISSDKAWYKISKGTLTGWCSSAYITINATYKTDEKFEAYLTEQGFPEDYKPGLRQIHAQYPNWIFKAEHLSMTWATAWAAESKVGRNTIQLPESWKSMEYGAYDWTSGEYVEFDTGGWDAAHPNLIAYYMDPRNFLNSTYLFQFEKLSYSNTQTVAGIQAILPSALDKHAADLFKASKEANVSAYFLATRMTQEGSQNNGLGTGTYPGYEGYYNFFHIGAYADDGRTAVHNGAIYAKNNGWNTPYKCLLGSAKYIGKSYINLGQDTLYYQKYNVVNTTSGLYAHQYMTNTRAAADEAAIRRQSASAEQLASNLTFAIPVYKSMPATVAALPSKTGNNDNFLDSITVSGHKLTPTFDRYTMAYSLHVGSDVAAVNVSAKLHNTKAKLTGTGTVKLNHGVNTVKLTATATSGLTRTYTITITRDGAPSGTAPTITGKVHSVADVVTKVEPETSVNKFITNLAVTNGTAKVFAAEGKQKTSGNIATGDILRLYNGTTLHASYPVVIYGDSNGDGKINSQDLRKAQRHILNVQSIDSYFLTAADVNKDGKLNSQDLRQVQRHVLGITATLQ